MAGAPNSGGEEIHSLDQLCAYLAGGEKPKARWRVGTEHEKLLARRRDLTRPGYDGPDGVRAVLDGFQRFGWAPVMEGENPIALTRGDCSISLEPGGQFELSGAPLATLHEAAAELAEHLGELKTVLNDLDLISVGLGFDPKWPRDDVPWMPKGRYRIMRAYMPKRGELGLDMMLRTCTVQANLDFSDERDMTRKFRASLALQPVATALFAASPFVDGRPCGFQSFRAQVWSDVDPDRCGAPDFVFEDGMGYQRYVDYALDVPMYFVHRDGGYIDASGQSFRDFMAGKLPALPGQRPSMGDFIDHLSTLFPDVRLKRYLEMRGADAGPARRLAALPALWVGLLYDELALDAALDLVAGWTAEDRAHLRRDAPRYGLATRIGGRDLREVAIQMLAIAREGLRRRGVRDGAGEDETQYLDPLFAVAVSGRNLADELLEAFHGDWAGSVDPVYRERAYF